MALLDGIRILEVAELLPGPYAGFLLASLGARVTKVERPGGDGARKLAPALFEAVNAGKEFVTLDLKTSEGKGKLAALLKESDAVLVSFRPKAQVDLQIDAENIRKIAPKIVHVSLTGYGLTGPYADEPGHDVNYQAVAGTLTGGIPPLPLADLAGGMSAAFAVCAGLVRQKLTGEGCAVDAGMTDAVAALASLRAAIPSQGRRGGYGSFLCKGGERLALGCIEPQFFESLFAALASEGFEAKEEWKTREGRREHAEELDAALAGLFEKTPRQKWLKLLKAADVPASPANTPAEHGKDPHLKARGFNGKLTPPFACKETPHGTV